MVYRLSESLKAFRIADMRHIIFDGTGAMLHGARWNSSGRQIIYAAETYSDALLEVLVHASGSIPKTHGYVEIQIPAGMTVETVGPEEIPGWDTLSFESTRAFGDRWYDERRTPVLLVPSVVTHFERNVLISQAHPDFASITASHPVAVRWDARLWNSVN